MGKTFSKVYVGDIVYILHNGGTLSEAKIIRYKRGVGISMVGIYTGDEEIDFWALTNKSSTHVPELSGTVYTDLEDVMDAIQEQIRITEKKLGFLQMSQIKVSVKLNGE